MHTIRETSERHTTASGHVEHYHPHGITVSYGTSSLYSIPMEIASEASDAITNGMLYCDEDP